MALKNLIKSVINKNTYFNDGFYKMLSKDRNIEIFKIYEEMEYWDTISDVSELQKFRAAVENGKNYYTTDPNISNSRIYGIWESIFGEFCKDNIVVDTPAVEHGLIFHNQIFTDLKYTARASCVTFGSFRKNIIKKYIKRPIFCVGPYIKYAKPFYQQDVFAEIKEKFGKTLVVFPTHSTNTSSITVREKKFSDAIKDIAKDYNSVIINAFWWNINDPLIKRLSAEGYHIASAGYRDDNKFLSRLKTIVALADLVVGDSIGTHVGYCISEKKPFKLLNLETKVSLLDKKEQSDIAFVTTILEDIKNQFYYNYKDEFSIPKTVIDVCNKYWGFDHIKTKKQIGLIYDINKEIMERCKGNIFIANYVGHKLLNEYREKDSEKYKILDEALI